jgi:type IV secretion system protein VirB10
MWRSISCALLACAVAFSLPATAPERDFSGNWILVYERSNTRALGAEPESVLTVKQDDALLRCSAAIDGDNISWSYNLGGAESRYRIGREQRNSVAKWEGAALLVNTLVSGPQSYTVMDRWRLSADRAVLTISRQVVRPAIEAEGTLVYRRAGSEPPPGSSRPVESAGTPAPGPRPQAPVLITRPAPAPVGQADEVYVVPAGTHVLLHLLNALNTKKSQEGDHVYLRTDVPVAANNRVVIPRGSDVAGTIIATKPAKSSGKGELYIRFDSITLPNGVTRDLLSRPDGAREGKLATSGDPSGDARRGAEGGAIGAGVGGLAGAAAGHPITGMGVGAAAGVAAGLAGVFHKKPEPILPSGTTMELVLDRDLTFTRDEIAR